MERAKIRSYLHYEIAIMRVPPFWRAAIFSTRTRLPEVDWVVEPIRAGNPEAAFGLAKVRINRTLADLAETITADRAAVSI